MSNLYTAMPKPGRTTKWCIALAIATIFNYWKLFYPSQYSVLIGVEAVKQAYSWFNFWIRSVGHGSLPLWDPYSSGGHSFPGEMQTAAFYPPYAVMLLFRPNQFGLLSAEEFNIVFIATHVLAALFMFAFVRELALTRFAAFVAGFSFSCAGFVGGVPAGWPHLLQSAIWLPLIALFLVRALRSTGRGALVRNGIFSGFFLGFSILAGGLHITIAQGSFIVCASVYYALTYDQGPVSTKAYLRIAIAGAIPLGVGLGVGAIQLVPSYLYSQHTFRWVGGAAFPSNMKIPYMYMTGNATSPNALSNFLFPSFDAVTIGETWSPYVGVLPFLLAALGVAKQWSNRWVSFLLGLAVAAFLYTLAGASALHGVLYVITPFLWIAREATRFVCLTTFCLPVLASYGLDYLCTGTAQHASWVVLKRWLSYSVGLCLLLFLLPVFFAKTGGFWQYFSLLLILMSSILLRFALSEYSLRTTPLFRVLVIGLIFFDLNGFNGSAGNKIASAGNDELEVVNSLKGAVDFLKAQPQPFRVKVFRDPEPNIEDTYGIGGLSGGGVTLDMHLVNVLGDLNLLNTQYFIKPVSAAEPGSIYQDQQWKVYRNPDAFPHFWIVHSYKKEASDPAMLKDVQSRHAELRQIAFVSDEPSGKVASAAQGSETIRLNSFSASEINLSISASAPGLLVLSEVYYPEWQASVNGRDTKILRTDEALRSVLIPAGKSVVRFRYRPYTVYVGALLSLLTCFFATMALLWRSPLRTRL